MSRYGPHRPTDDKRTVTILTVVDRVRVERVEPVGEFLRQQRRRINERAYADE